MDQAPLGYLIARQLQAQELGLYLPPALQVYCEVLEDLLAYYRDVQGTFETIFLYTRSLRLSQFFSLPSRCSITAVDSVYLCWINNSCWLKINNPLNGTKFQHEIKYKKKHFWSLQYLEIRSWKNNKLSSWISGLN